MSKVTYTIITLMLLTGFCLICNPACTSDSSDDSKVESEPIVKPDPGSQDLMEDEEPKRQPQKPSGKVLPPPPDREIQVQNARDNTRLGYISYALSSYRDAFGRMPDSIEQVMEEWMFLWPGNLHNNKPVKVLDHKPDPNNKADFGNIYYEKTDDNTAHVYLIILDHESSKDNVKWITQEQVVFFERQGMLEYPEHERWDELKQLLKRPEVEIQDYFFMKQMFFLLRVFISDGMKQEGSLNFSFGEMLKRLNIYVTPNGLQNLQTRAGRGSFSFEFGDADTGEHTFFQFTGMQDELKGCWHLLPELGIDGTVDRMPESECPEFGPNARSILSTENLDSIIIPSDRIITKEDIR